LFSVSLDPSSESGIVVAPLLEHLFGMQPHDIPQQPPDARHWHLDVLHNEYLLQAQHTGTAVAASPEQSDLEFSGSWISPVLERALFFKFIFFLCRFPDITHSSSVASFSDCTHSSSIKSLSECSDSDVSISSNMIGVLCCA
jgi:hypothetical protein